MSFATRSESPSGLAMLCDDNGGFTVIRDDLGLCCDHTSLFKVVDSASVEKANNFLQAITSENAAFGWELNVIVQGAATPFQFAGSRAGDKKLVIGGATRSDVSRVSEELMAMNSEQSTALRNALKDLSLFQRDKAERDSRMFDELSRLNNELVTLQREVARKNHELERLNNLKNTFLGMASHDLRKPIAVVQMNAELIASEKAGPVSSGQTKLLEGMVSSCKTVIRQLSDFLDIAQIESGRLKISRSKWNLARLVKSRLQVHQAIAAKKQITIELNAPNSADEIPIDSDRAGQVIDNLIENGVKYSPPASTIRITIASTAEGATFTVKDEGPGLSAEQIENLFLPFKQVGSKTTADERSSGLGLAIVKAIMDEHHGRITVRSEPPNGATFEAFFPNT